MSGALERVCAELGVKIEPTRKNPAAELIAESIIRHAQEGVRTKAALHFSDHS